MFSDPPTRKRLLTALRQIIDITDQEDDPAAASGIVIRWIDKESRGLEVILVSRRLDRVEVIVLLGNELRRAVSRGLAEDVHVSRVEIATRKVIGDIEDDIEEAEEFRFLA